MARSVGILNKLKQTLPQTVMLQLYYALVHPLLLYGIIIWGATCPSYRHVASGGAGAAMPPPIFVFAPPRFFSCPPRYFFGRKKLVFLGGKNFKICDFGQKKPSDFGEDFFFFF